MEIISPLKTFFQMWKETSFLTFLNITWIFKSNFRRFGHNKNDKLMSCYEFWQKTRSLDINSIPFGVRYSLWGAPSEVRFSIKMISWSQFELQCCSRLHIFLFVDKWKLKIEINIYVNSRLTKQRVVKSSDMFACPCLLYSWLPANRCLSH